MNLLLLLPARRGALAAVPKSLLQPLWLLLLLAPLLLTLLLLLPAVLFAPRPQLLSLSLPSSSSPSASPLPLLILKLHEFVLVQKLGRRDNDDDAAEARILHWIVMVRRRADCVAAAFG